MTEYELGLLIEKLVKKAHGKHLEATNQKLKELEERRKKQRNVDISSRTSSWR